MTTWLRRRYPSDISRVLILRLAGAHAVGTNVGYRPTHWLTLCVVFASFLVWAVAASITYGHPYQAFTEFLPWCVYFLALAVSLFRLCHQLTQAFLHITVALDHALTVHGRLGYDNWSKTSLSTPLQAGAGVAGAVGAPSALAVVSQIVGDSSPVLILPASYAIVAFTGFWVGSTAYWAIFGIILCRTLSKPRRLNLYPLAPAKTPAVEELSQLMITAFAMSGVYSVALLFPFVYWTKDLSEAPISVDSAFTLNIIRLILIGICGLATLGVGLFPQYHLSTRIRAVRRTAMLALLRKLHESPATWRGTAVAPEASLFDKVSNSPASTLGSANVVQVAVGLAAATIPFAVGIFGITGSG